MGVSSCKRTENDTLGYTPIVPDWCRIRPDLTGRLKHGKCRISAIFWTSPDVLGRTNGAQERTRTFTTLRPLAPEASASTNSATWAGVLWSGAVTRPGGGLSTHLPAVFVRFTHCAVLSRGTYRESEFGITERWGTVAGDLG